MVGDIRLSVPRTRVGWMTSTVQSLRATIVGGRDSSQAVDNRCGSILKQSGRMDVEPRSNSNKHHQTWIPRSALNPAEVSQVNLNVMRKLLLA